MDFLRGFAIVAMIQTHLWSAFFRGTSGTAPGLHRWLVAPLGGHAAPWFVLVSGASAWLTAQRLRTGTSDVAGAQVFLRRGLALFALSTLVNVIAGPWLHVLDISLLNWGVIQLIGLCLCLVPVFVRLNWLCKVAWVAVPLAMSEWVCPTAGSVRVLCTGFAPPFPWAALFFAGTMVGQGYLWAWRSRSIQRLGGLALVGVLALVPIGLVLHRAYRPVVWGHLSNMGLTSAIVFVGDFLLLMVLLGYLLDYRGLGGKIVDAVVGLGQHALTAYYLQLGAIVLMPMLIWSLMDRSPALSAVWFFPLLFLALLLLHVIINVVWRRFEYRLSLEWWLLVLVKGGRGRRMNANTQSRAR